jgi:hypothetical protein
MVIGLILLIIKIVFLFIIQELFFVGCTSTKVLIENPVPAPKEFKVKNIKIGPLVSGPTAPGLSKMFIDKTESYGLSGIKSIHNYVVDYNDDGFSDLVILPSYYSTPKFYKFNKDLKRFEEEKRSPFKEEFRVSHLYFVDLNHDGILDVIAGTLNQKSELPKIPLLIFKGEVDKNGVVSYKKMSTDIPLKPMPTSAIVIFDFDLDGKLDIFLGNWHVKNKKGFTPDRLLQGDKDGFTFKDVSLSLEKEHRYDKSLKLHPHATPTFGASSCDVNLDGFPDLLVASSGGFPNRLWMNIQGKDGARIFRDYGKESMIASDIDGKLARMGGGNTTFINCIDYNNDKIMDLIIGEITPAFSPDTLDRSSVLSGKTFSFPPKFIRSPYYSDDGDEEWSQGDRRAVWFDYNFDGLVDLLVENSGFPPRSRLVLFSQEEDHAYSDIGELAGVNILNPSGVVTADFNGDGRIDILTGQSRVRDASISDRVYLYENNIPYNGKRTLTVILKGAQANIDGIGATVTLVTKDREQKRYVEYVRGGLASQNQKNLIFGLGTGFSIPKIKVSWPIGKKNSIGNIVPVVREYSLSGYRFKTHLTVMLSDDGKFTVLKMF